MQHSNIPEKANWVLNLIFLTLVLIVLRLWHLSVIQYDKRLEDASKPQKRVVVEPARRATIRDRFNLPLAINKIQYRASIVYSEFRQIPSVVWTKDANGKKVKTLKRKEYIVALSNLLADELQLDPERLEDLIFSKAALYYHRPFLIKEDLSEKEYYRLKMLERNWYGIHVQCIPKRTYPLGKIGADIIGYMGAINQQEYEAIIGEIKALEKYRREFENGGDPPTLAGILDPDHAQKRLKELQERAYTLNDSVGKTGIEARFDGELRGYQGKKYYYSDARGNFLRELPGSREPLQGHRFLLSISAELQEYAEKLLVQNERIREAKVSNPSPNQQTSTKQPWIKGGSIIAMDPYTGEVLAMASYPRFDPNDFVSSSNPEVNIRKQTNISRWLENEDYLAQIWDQKIALERERYDEDLEKFVDEGTKMSWEDYLDHILPPINRVRNGLHSIRNVKGAIELQKSVEELLVLSGQNNLFWLFDVLYRDGKLTHSQKLPVDIRQAIEENLEQQSELVEKLRQFMDPIFDEIPNHYDKGLLVDLCRIAVCGDRFSESLIKRVGGQSLTEYRDASAAMAAIEPFVRNMIRTIYRSSAFKEWRVQNGKEFIQIKRKEEKLNHKYARPSIDYFDEKEAELFQAFWNSNRWVLVLAFLQRTPVNDELKPYVGQLYTWNRELEQGAHANVPWRDAYHRLQELIQSFSHPLALEYFQTLRCFRELDRPLLSQYKHLRKLKGKTLEKHLASAFYPLYGFGYGRSHAYRQASIQGSLFKLVTAYAALAQNYKQLGVAKVNAGNLNPLTISDYVQRNGKETMVGTHANGVLIPQKYKGGRIPLSISKTLGKMGVIRALETSSNPYFAVLAGDILEDPEDLISCARQFSYGSKTGIDLPGEYAGRLPNDVSTNRTGLYCTAIGQHTLVVTPLQAAVMLCSIANGGKVLKPQIIHMSAGVNTSGWVKPTHAVVKYEMFMPNQVRKMLLDGMYQAVAKMQQNGASLSSLSKFYRDYPEAISDYLELKDQFVGKTSTAESVERIDLDLVQGANKYTHVWFGGISFDSDGESFLARDEYGRPELVVVVYLRFGKYGKEAAPTAAQIVKKWREIKSKVR